MLFEVSHKNKDDTDVMAMESLYALSRIYIVFSTDSPVSL